MVTKTHLIVMRVTQPIFMVITSIVSNTNYVTQKEIHRIPNVMINVLQFLINARSSKYAQYTNKTESKTQLFTSQ